MKKAQVMVLVAAVALVAGLFSLPKVLVVNDNKRLATEKPTQPAADDHAAAPVSPAQTAALARLQGAYARADSKNKLMFADSLAIAYAQAGKPDSAAVYWELIAVAQPTLPHLMRAADGYYEAFGFAVDNDRAARFGAKARELYQKVLAQNPDVLDAKSKMAMTYVATATPMQGIALLREVVADDPDNQLALFNLGVLSMRSGQFDKALERFEKITSRYPDNVQAQFYLGVCYAETGNKAAARRILEAVQRKEKDPAVQQSVKEYLDKLSQPAGQSSPPGKGPAAGQ